MAATMGGSFLYAPKRIFDNVYGDFTKHCAPG